ncbi:MAG: class I SAM-dependent methyltransferase [Candidatus Micrarchaeota archaeon]
MQVYNEIASEWEKSRKTPFSALKFFLPKIQPGDRALDAGCGNGRNLVEIARGCKEAYGIDSSFEMLKYARQRLLDSDAKNACVVDGQIQKIPFSASFFDEIACIAALHHLIPKEQPQAILEFSRTLKKGGLLFVSVWSENQSGGKKEASIEWKVPGGIGRGRYYYFFKKGELEGLLEGKGFEIMDSFYEKDGKKVPLEKSQNLVVFARKLGKVEAI